MSLLLYTFYYHIACMIWDKNIKRTRHHQWYLCKFNFTASEGPQNFSTWHFNGTWCVILLMGSHDTAGGLALTWSGSHLPYLSSLISLMTHPVWCTDDVYTACTPVWTITIVLKLHYRNSNLQRFKPHEINTVQLHILWSDIIMIFVNYTKNTEFLSQKISLQHSKVQGLTVPKSQ